MELSWYGRTCIRLRGRDAVVVHDAYPAIVGPTGRGITADITTYSHPDDTPRIESAIADALQTGVYEADYRAIRPDGGLSETA